MRGRFTAEDLDFQEKIAYRTGLGDDTAVVPAIQAGRDEALGMEPARFEFAATCFPTIQELLDKAGVRADQVNFVITNSSLFNPTPSLSAMIVNHFKMSKKTIGYSLGGMGCSAGIIALDLARELLELHPNSYALVVSHENITNNFYVGRSTAATDCYVCLQQPSLAAVLFEHLLHAGSLLVTKPTLLGQFAQQQSVHLITHTACCVPALAVVQATTAACSSPMSCSAPMAVLCCSATRARTCAAPSTSSATLCAHTWQQTMWRTTVSSRWRTPSAT
jgi:hypothetical protein